MYGESWKPYLFCFLDVFSLPSVCLSDDREDFKQRRTTSRTKMKQGLDTRIFWEIHVAGMGRLWGARKGKERRERGSRLEGKTAGCRSCCIIYDDMTGYETVGSNHTSLLERGCPLSPCCIKSQKTYFSIHRCPFAVTVNSEPTIPINTKLRNCP